MRAVVISSFGGVEGIGVQEAEPPPAPTADRVRGRVHAGRLNRADILQRLGKYPPPPGYPEKIPGMELAGEVEAIGSEIRAWKIGDRGFGIVGGWCAGRVGRRAGEQPRAGSAGAELDRGGRDTGGFH